MDAGDWTPEEWAALTREDAPPERAYQPWGRPLTETHPEQLQDADYIARKLLDIGSAYAGPIGWAANYVVPRTEPASELLRQGEEAQDYIGKFLGPLMALLATKQWTPKKMERPWHTEANQTRKQLDEWRKDPPWKGREAPTGTYYEDFPVPPIGGPTGKGIRLEDIPTARTTHEQDKAQQMRLMLEEMARQMQARGGSR